MQDGRKIQIFFFNPLAFLIYCVKVSDGAIVGNAIIKLFAQYGPAAVPHIEAFVRDMAQAVHNA